MDRLRGAIGVNHFLANSFMPNYYKPLFLLFTLLSFSILFNPSYGQSTKQEIPASFKGNLIYLHPIIPKGDTLNFLTSSSGIFRNSNRQIRLEGGSYTSNGAISQDSNFSRTNSKTVQPINGIIDVSWFPAEIWTFDFIKNKLIYHPISQTEHPKLPKNHIPFDKKIQFKHEISIPNISIIVDGDSLNFLIDTGAALFLKKLVHQALDDGQEQIRGTSYISRSLFEEWHFKHPDWLIYEDVEQFYSSNMIKVPTIEFNNQKIGPVWFTTRPDNYYSKINSSIEALDIAGGLGGSFLKYFKVTINYKQGYAIFKKADSIR